MKQLFRLFFYLLSKFSRRKRVPENPGKILVVMCHWLGDTFWAMQVIPALKERFPEAEVFVAVKPFARHLFHAVVPDDHVLVQRDIISDRRREKGSLMRFIRSAREARRHRFDLGVDLTCNRYSASFLFLAKIPSVGVDIEVNEATPLYDIRTRYPENGREHYRKRAWKVIEPLGLSFDHSDPVYPRPKLDVESVRRKYNLDPSVPTALFLPGAGWPDKEWPPSDFAEIGGHCESKGFRVIVSGSPKEKELCGRIAEALSEPVVMLDDIPSLLALIPHLTFALSNDSGVAHLVAAAGVPLAVVFIATDPATCAPIGGKVRIFKDSPDAVDGIKQYVDESLASTSLPPKTPHENLKNR